MQPEIFDIFLITGQSNSSGAPDRAGDEDALRENAVVPAPGTAYCLDVKSDFTQSDIYDLSAGRAGYSPALAKRWNELSGRGVFVIQTAVAGSPVDRWEYGNERRPETGKNLLDNTIAAAKQVLALGKGENPRFRFGDIYYFWCQGETAQAHEWTGTGWKMPGVHIMDTETYYRKFTAFHYGLLSHIDVKAGSVMLVRTLPRVSSPESLRLGLLTDNNASKAAQYTIHATFGGKVRIQSRICDIARKETTPGPGAGYMGPDNVHYRKKGYNAQGRELAENLWRWMHEGEKEPTGFEWIAPDGRTRLQPGQILPVDALRGAQTSAMVLPYEAKDPRVGFRAEGEGCTVDRFGKITFAPGTPVGTRAQVTAYAAYGASLTVTAECAEPAPAVCAGEGVVTDYLWNFSDGNLREYNEYNNLTAEHPDRMTASPEGIRLGSGGLVPQKRLFVSDAYSWSASWKASLCGETPLFSGGACRLDTGLARGTGRCVRFVSSEGRIFELPYASDGAEEALSLAYSAETRRLTLSGGGGVLSETEVSGPFSGCFTAVLGKTGSTVSELNVTMYTEQE